MPVIQDNRFKRLKKKVGQAIGQFGMIEEGDRIAVAVSGGKDSLTLLHILAALQRRAPISYQLVAVTVDPGFEGFDSNAIRSYLEQEGFEHHVEYSDAAAIIEEKRRPGSSYCAFCARLRRGALYTMADQLGCNKLALGHHLDDFIETLLLNQFFVGSLKGMSPKLVADNGRHTVIRPLVFVEESEIIAFAEGNQIPTVGCSCAFAACFDLNRQRMKQLVNRLQQEIPDIRRSLIGAMGNIEPRHLLDPKFNALLPQDGKS
ncbi:MAG: tRNA 2-thiocytidine(32) synthetase TtcA [Desulfuromonas sp.]|nr:MAG: tRNA 2-thiocytidine(32) synthetase TtcA [Desulfuromonas sp.]